MLATRLAISTVEACLTALTDTGYWCRFEVSFIFGRSIITFWFYVISRGIELLFNGNCIFVVSYAIYIGYFLYLCIFMGSVYTKASHRSRIASSLRADGFVIRKFFNEHWLCYFIVTWPWTNSLHLLIPWPQFPKLENGDINGGYF